MLLEALAVVSPRRGHGRPSLSTGPCWTDATHAFRQADQVIAVREDDVLVGTNRSPEGKPVPLEWVQSAIDNAAEGEVEISTDSVEHRSAFVGAVLASLPGTRGDVNPRRVLVARSGDKPRTGWREPPELADALDALDDIAGGRPCRSAGSPPICSEEQGY